MAFRLTRSVQSLVELRHGWRGRARIEREGTAHHLLGALFAEIAAAETRLEPAALRAILEPARAVFAESPLVRRMQTWPRGLPGDFETIEHLLDGRNRCERGSLAWFIEHLVRCCPAVDQHRNKLRHQASEVRRVLESPAARSPRILSLAAGGARDLASALDRYRGPIDATVNDIDHDALALARRRLANFGNRIRYIEGSALQVARSSARGRFDLVLAGGLFDYLDERAASFLLRAVDRLLAPDGVFFWTNIGAGNPQRAWMEHLGDWHLLERDENDILNLARRAGIAAERLSLSREESGLTWLVRIRSPSTADASVAMSAGGDLN